nr:autotransporter outer membrane beta-barrel domain-containing protein [Enterobacter kobei]
MQASVETGYAFVFPGSKNMDYIIEPQAQVIWNGVKADEHFESHGSVVNSEGTNNLHTRLGVKGAIEIRTGREDANTVWKPYVTLNWHHNTKEYGVRMDNITLSAAGARNSGELKMGVEGQLTKQLGVSGGASGQMGSDDYRDLGGYLRVNYNF